MANKLVLTHLVKQLLLKCKSLLVETIIFSNCNLIFQFLYFFFELQKRSVRKELFHGKLFFHGFLFASQKPFEIKIVRKWAGFQSLNKYWRHRRPDQVFNWTAKSPLWSPVIIAFNCIYVSGFIRAVFSSDSTSPKGVPSKTIY